MKHIGTIENIPAGICNCTVNGLDVTIISLSKEHVCVRFSDKPKEKEASIDFDCFFWHEKGLSHFGPYIGRLENVNKKEYWWEAAYLIDSSDYSEMVDRVSKQLGDYIEMRADAYDNSFSGVLVGYPDEKNDEFETSYGEWFNKKSEAFNIDDFKKYVQALNCEVAVSLETEDLVNAYLVSETDFPFSRIYVGNAFCHLLRPGADVLKKVFKKACKDDIGVTIVLPYLREELIEEETAFLDEILLFCKEEGYEVEFEINDYGFAQMLNERGVKFSLGRLLCKRRKDPRLKYKDRIEFFTEEMKSNSLNDDAFLEKVKRLGLKRVEMESPGYEVRVPNVQTSLHLPFYQTNTSQFCPLQALIKHKDRGCQRLIKDCGRECLENNVLYANHLSLVGMYNSVFALDTWLLENPGVLNKYIDLGVDRIVWNYRGFDYDNNSRNGDHR